MQSHEQRNRIARGGSRRRPIGQRSSRPKIAALPPARLRRVMTHIDASLDQRLDVPSLAAVAGLSPGHFAAMFKRATGMPPHQAVTRRRLARAIELLADGRLSIAEIGCQLGFSSHAHFCTTFRRRHGVSPTAWRTLQRGKASDDIRQTQTGYSTNTRNSSADFESHP